MPAQAKQTGPFSKQKNKRGQWGFISLSVLVAALSAGTGQVAAQAPQHTGLKSCENYARQWYKEANPADFVGVNLLEDGLDEEKYEQNVGKQFISTVLTGFGQLRYKHEKPTPIQFTCLLESDKKAVFFHPIEGPAPDTAQQCWIHFEPGNWGGLTDCLKLALAQAEGTLAQLEDEANTQAQKVLAHWPNSNAPQTLNNSSTAWQTYREQECARRDAFRTGGNHPDITRYECLIHKTEERIQDFRFEKKSN